MPIIGGGFFGGGSGGGGGSSYIDGEVATYNDLPVSTSAAPVNSAYLVRQGSGVYLVNRKPAGIYVRNTANGNLADWAYAGDFPDVFNDDNFTVYDGTDTSKNLKLELSGITANTTRTLTAPDKNGTIATLSDLPSPTTDASLLTSGTLALARLDPLVSLDNLNNNFTVGQTITAAANTSALTASYSVTGANTTPLIDLSGTWNTTGVANGIRLNITDTASAAASQLLTLQSNSLLRFQVRKDGIAYAGHWVTTPTGYRVSPNPDTSLQTMQLGTAGLSLVSTGTLNWASGSTAGTGDTFLARDAANILAQRNGTNAQAFRLYNTFTDASNFERGFIRWNGNLLEIGNEAGGTGNANRSINLLSGGNIEFICGGVFAASFRAARSIITTPLNFAATSLASDPTTGDLASGRAGVYKNTTSGAVRLWYNDGGTLRSVQLT